MRQGFRFLQALFLSNQGVENLARVTVGFEAPDFSLPDQDGNELSLSHYKGKKHVVLLFYPLDWTPI